MSTTGDPTPTPFPIGTVVQLKSGGPGMTVTSSQEDLRTFCSWFVNDEIRGECFRPEALMRADDTPATPVPSQWVSTAERMPTEEDANLNGLVRWAIIEEGAYVGPWNWGDSERYTHWCPLPKKP